MFGKYSRVIPIPILNIPNELFRENYLIRDIYQMFYPFHLAMTLLFSAKFTIKNGFIAPNGWRYFTIVLFILSFVTVSYSCRIFLSYTYDIVPRGKLQPLVTVVFFIFYCICFNTLYIFNIVKSQNNVFLVLKIQMIHKSICKDKNITRNIVLNRILCFAIVTCNIMVYTCLFIYNPQYDTWDFVFDLLFISFDVNLIYAIRIIMLLSNYLKEWKNNIECISNVEANNMYCKKMVEVYKNILEAFELYKNVSEMLIIFWVVDIFSRPIFYIETAIEMIRLLKATDQLSTYDDLFQKDRVIVWILKLVWILKDMLLNITLSINFEKFYIAIENTNMCLQNKKYSFKTENQKRLCKNVLHLHRAMFSKMIVCGLFTIDAVFPFYLLALLTKHVCILLQFALTQ